MNRVMDRGTAFLPQQRAQATRAMVSKGGSSSHHEAT